MFTLRPPAEEFFRQSAPRGFRYVSHFAERRRESRHEPSSAQSRRADCGRALPGRAIPYFSASVSSPNHSGRWKSGRKWTMGAQEPKWGWIVSSHL